MKILLLMLLLIPAAQLSAQTGIGTTSPDPSSLLEIRSTTKGLLMPRVTSPQVTAIVSPAKGLMVYDSVLNRMMINTGTPTAPNWKNLFSEANGWSTTGNGAIDLTTNFIGTTNSQPVIFKTNGAEWMRIAPNGQVGIGSDTPGAKLELQGTGSSAPQLLLKEDGINIASRLRFNNRNISFRNWEFRSLIDTSGFDNDKFSFTHGTIVNAEIMSLLGSGRVGIGTSTPRAELEVQHDNTSTIAISGLGSSDTSQLQFINRTNGTGSFPITIGTTFTMASRGSNGLLISSASLPSFTFKDIMHMSPQGNVTIMDGGAFSIENAAGNAMIEMTPTEASGQGGAIGIYNVNNIQTVDIDGDFGANHRGRMILDEIQIKGGADFAEDFNITADADNPEPLPGMLVSVDPLTEGSVCITNEKMDKKVVGVISGANGISAGMLMGQKGTLAYGDHPVALAGRVYVLATNEGGEIAPGDLITSSSTRGYAMKAPDSKRAHGTIIGKAMSKRNPTTGYVLVLVNLQ